LSPGFTFVLMLDPVLLLLVSTTAGNLAQFA
jgi:hypothetical protein